MCFCDLWQSIHSLGLYECIAWLACMPTIPYFSSLNLQCVNLLFHRVIILSRQLAHFTVCSEKHASHLECLWLDFHDWSMRIYCLLFITSQSLKIFLTTLIQCKSFLTFSAFNEFLWQFLFGYMNCMVLGRSACY